MADPSAIDAALIARLTDPALQALMPAGPYFDLAPKGATAMTIVAIDDAETTGIFDDEEGFERTVYVVKAVESNTSGTRAAQAAARIKALLAWPRDAPPPLQIVGYELQALRYIKRLRYTEIDSDNPDARWQHQGGLYEVITTPTGG